MKQLALFDFDETITKTDTLIPGIKFVVGTERFKRGMKTVNFFLPFFKKKLISSTIMKNIVSWVFFRGQAIDFVETQANQYATTVIPENLDDWHMERLQWHRDENHEIIVVTASFDLWVKAWCEKHKLKYITTQLATNKDKYTGLIVGKNCYGDEKIRRIKQLVNIGNYNEIYSYTDSLTDKCMLDIATHPFLNKEVFTSNN